MDTTIIAAFIGVGGIILGITLEQFLPNWIEAFRSRGIGIPNVIGTWRGKWYVGEGAHKTLYTEDIITIEKRKGFRILGKAQEAKGTYLIYGRFSMSNIFTLSYHFPDTRISLTGVILLKLDPLSKEFDGRWWGYTKEGSIMGGEVQWTRV
ncbi:MAG TPA: hypothetical protein VF546_00995 [Pyrinomonadaceae bacterium]|jgi:hypothetical protein